MTGSQRVAQHISDNESGNDMDLESFHGEGVGGFECRVRVWI
jgi:hypothetical protein